MSLSITDVARRTGVPTSTLRYYDGIGLLASSGRADNGYRQYDERALDRLRFIARAKGLGCSLEEIATLLRAFDEDCGEVQAPLRDLVDGKIALAQRHVAELVALTAQLQEARHALAAETAQGPCGSECVCVDDESPQARRPLTMVQLTAAPEVSCTLGHEQMNDRIADWQAVLANVRERSPLEGGIRLTFGPDADIAEVARLARDEWACCSFFEFVLTVDGRGTALEVRAPAEAEPLLASVFGVAA
ncbi:MAG: MerR family transcriptional regulator [Chloroflexi bacterium]|nr:MerR family transcriptional regulator [Chloroflexota bacterium]